MDRAAAPCGRPHLGVLGRVRDCAVRARGRPGLTQNVEALLAEMLLRDREGVAHIVDSQNVERPVLLLVLSPTCKFCAENWPNWDVLIARHLERGGQVVPIDITGDVDDDYLRDHGIAQLPVLTQFSVTTMTAYRLRSTPQTAILADGRVQAVWSGVMSPADVANADSILAGEATTVALQSATERP